MSNDLTKEHVSDVNDLFIFLHFICILIISLQNKLVNTEKIGFIIMFTVMICFYLKFNRTLNNYFKSVIDTSIFGIYSTLSVCSSVLITIFVTFLFS